MRDQQIFMLTVLVGMILFVGFMPTNLGKPDGIYPIGDGRGVVLCGESITLNADSNIEEKDLYDMFDEAMLVIEENCNEK
jgi:hypothetical protein